MLADLAAGRLDAAVMWGPIGGPLAAGAGDALVVTPLLHEEGAPRLVYRITMGVRQGEDVWKRELNAGDPRAAAGDRRDPPPLRRAAGG